MRGRGIAAAVMAAALAFPCAASAQQVTGLTVTQDVGFTTLKWNPVAGATDYQIERAPAGTPEATAGTVGGVGAAPPTITPDKPAFADSGFKLGDSFRWRVRARFGTGTA